MVKAAGLDRSLLHFITTVIKAESLPEEKGKGGQARRRI
jgi:hypothetical protein